MKLLQFCMALIISLTLGLAAAPIDSFAKDAAKDTTTSEKKSSSTKSTSKSSSSTSKSGSTSTKSTKSDTSKKKVAAKPVNINTASKAELQTLPGVGPVMADAILKYKKANGKFKSADDLLNVKGIGEKTLKKMKPLLKF